MRCRVDGGGRMNIETNRKGMGEYSVGPITDWNRLGAAAPRAILTSIWDLSIVIFGIHAILEDKVYFLVAQSLSCNATRKSRE